MVQKMRICYINISTQNPRDQVTIRGLRENEVMVSEITDNRSGFKKIIKIIKKYHQSKNLYDLLIIGYTGAILVPWLRFVSRKKIIYNAGNSFYESMNISRDSGRVKTVWYWLIDFFAFHLANHILVESERQKKFIAKTFFIQPKKISVHLTGVDDRDFYFDPKIQKLETFTAVFRGKFLPEAGVDIIIRAAKLLENSGVKIRVIGRGFLEKEIRLLIAELKPQNLELITDVLSSSILREKMQECHLALGQMANHSRLLRTIPHKAFESAAMRLPYLSRRNDGLLELFEADKTCFCVNSSDEYALAKKIIFLKNNSHLLNQVARNAFDPYQNTFTSKVLGGKLVTKLIKVFPFQH